MAALVCCRCHGRPCPSRPLSSPPSLMVTPFVRRATTSYILHGHCPRPPRRRPHLQRLLPLLPSSTALALIRGGHPCRTCLSGRYHRSRTLGRRCVPFLSPDRPHPTRLPPSHASTGLPSSSTPATAVTCVRQTAITVYPHRLRKEEKNT
ncbi:Os03g0791125 [Oryza sativa Japonica Group]|uniref:Os03g0791125 protein n=1 Tax=Oryza sativa subsp. japonica TaxID=39947 RepID=A0A0P0W4K6_ORYSJ|nr:Os03g0791125 [Oryza sativa Japonica Group]